MKKNTLPTGTFPMDMNSDKSGRFSVPAKNGGKKNRLPSGSFPMDLSNGKGNKGKFSPK